MREGNPVILREEACMHCHHCYAACPVGAIEMDGLDVGVTKAGALPTVSEVVNLLEHRYSCREYKKGAVTEEKLAVLRRALRTAPTGCNARGVRYLIFDNEEQTDRFREAIKEHVLAADPVVLKSDPFLRAIALMLKRGMDPVLRGAPHLVLAAYDEKNAPTGEADCAIGLATFDFAAQALGLGTCWCGFICMAIARLWPDMAQALGVPEGFRLSYAMLFGEKAFDYIRPVMPNELVWQKPTI